MPANKKPRKAYRPKRVLMNTMAIAAESVALVRSTHPEYLTKQNLITYNCLEELRLGRGNRDHLCNLIAAHYICSSFADRLNIGTEHRPLLEEAAQALRDLTTRAAHTGSHTMRATELEALRSLAELQDAIFNVATVREVEVARSEAMKALRRNETKGSTVV